MQNNQLDRNKAILRKYIPEPAVELIAVWIVTYDFKLKIKKSRSSKYGDYRPPRPNTNHQITINNDLNPYAFLITLVHEIAHLGNFNKNKNRVLPHGVEWKQEYKEMMKHFLHAHIFPADVILALSNYMKNPAASSCSDVSLLRVLKKYDTRTDTVLLEEVPEKTMFKIKGERLFIKGERIRKRFRCKEVKSNRDYLFNPLSEVVVC